jgi:hypothetical protein
MFGVGLDVMSDVDVSDVEDKLFSSLLRAVGAVGTRN